MTSQDNAAQAAQQDDIIQPVLTDDEIREIQGTHLNTIGSIDKQVASVIVAGRAIESAVLSKLCAPVADGRQDDIAAGLQDSAYCAGLQRGFVLGNHNDNDGLRRALESRDGYVKTIKDASAALASAPAPFDRRQLRALVDVVWNEATESTAVPDTPWADRMIDKVFSSLPASAPVGGEEDEDLAPPECPITRRPLFMAIEHPELGMVPTYGGPFDSYTIPYMDGEAHQPWHERELFVRRYDHDLGGWRDDESIPLRVIHDDVLHELQDAASQVSTVAGEARDAALWREYSRRFPTTSEAFAEVHGTAAPQASAEYERGHADGWAAGWDQAQADKDGGQQRACTCHPDDRPAGDCQKQYAATDRRQRSGDAADPNNYKGMFEAAVSALAQIDRKLGLPEDGCNSPQATVAALSEFISGFDHLKKEWEGANKARAALSPTQPEQGERDAK